MSSIRINAPLEDSVIFKLKAGDRVLIEGTVYTARDAAHSKLKALIENNQELPINLVGQVIYYVGPTPAPEGKVIGSAGPTTSTRMDRVTPILLERGLKGMIGKGDRSTSVIDSIIKNKCVYFAAIGGAGALIADSIIESEIIAFPELGTEAIRKLTVKNFPAIVAIDSFGNNLYNQGPLEYLEKIRDNAKTW